MLYEPCARVDLVVVIALVVVASFAAWALIVSVVANVLASLPCEIRTSMLGKVVSVATCVRLPFELLRQTSAVDISSIWTRHCSREFVADCSEGRRVTRRGASLLGKVGKLLRGRDRVFP